MGLRKYLFLVLGLAGTLSCTREAPEVKTEDLVAVVPGEENASKAVLGVDGQFTWTAGDEIAIWYESSTYSFSQYYNAKLVSGAGNKTATFRVEKNGERTGYALYPAHIADNKYPGLDAHRLRVVLPDEYELADGRPSSQPILAENVAGNNLTFFHLASLLRLTLNNIPEGTRALRISSDADIAGPYRVSFPTGTGEYPYIETAECTNPGSHSSVLFTYSTALTAAETRVVDVPVPQGVYMWFRVEALADNMTTVLSSASVAQETGMRRASIKSLNMDLSGGPARLVSFSLSDVTSILLPGQSVPVNASVRQVRAGGGTETANGYKLEAVGVSNPDVLELFVRDNVIRVRGLIPGVATIRVKVSKGDDSLCAETEIRVASIDGVNVRVDRGKMFTEWYMIIPAQVISESVDVTSDELFDYKWELLPSGTPLARLEGAGSTVTLWSGGTIGTVTVKCTVSCKSNPSIFLSGQSEVSFEDAVGIMKSPFSVSNTQQVYFGTGNLLQDNSSGEFSLCPDQLYACLGIEDLTLPPLTAAKRDMFDREVNTLFSSPYTSSHIFIGGEETIGWVLLSKEEFDYLFTLRTTAAGRASKIGKLSNARYILAEVDGREGVIIFPDIFVWPSELPAPQRVNANVEPATNKYTRAEWNKYLETAGAVFLVGGMYGPVSYLSGLSMRFDYNYICYRTRDDGYIWFPLYSGSKYTYNSTIPYPSDNRYMRVRPVKRIYK